MLLGDTGRAGSTLGAPLPISILVSVFSRHQIIFAMAQRYYAQHVLNRNALFNIFVVVISNIHSNSPSTLSF
jgi:hypothetical protein